MSLPPTLLTELELAGYFPDTARAALERAVRESRIRSYLVRPETTFDGPEVRRHLTILALTDEHLLIIHLDDESADALNPTQVIVSTERIKLARVGNLALAQAYDTDGTAIAPREAEVTLGLSWGSNRRLDIQPAWCDDPQCSADHGYTGDSREADLVLRVSALADGDQAIADALAFFDALYDATQ